MKTLKNIQCYLTLVLFFLFTNYSFSQEWEATDFGYSGHSIDFLDANTGFRHRWCS